MTEIQSVASAQSSLPQGSQISLVDLLDRLLGTGVVLAGDVLISLAGVDLVQIRLHALITTVRADMAGPRNLPGPYDD
jgi:Gas vesicle protein